MFFCEQLRRSSPGVNVGAAPSPGWRRSGACICSLFLVIGLSGCQAKVNKSSSVPPPLPPAPSQPRAARPVWFVKVSQLKLRACPGLDCPQTSTLEINTEVEKMGEIGKWTQIKVKKDGSLGYVSSRYLSPHPVEAAKRTRKPSRKAKIHQAAPPPDVARGEEEAAPHKQEPSPRLPRVM